MSEKIQIENAQEQFLELLEKVQAGEEFLFMRGEQPVAKLIRAHKRPAIGELEPSFVGIDTDIIDEPDEKFNKGFYKDI
jgi:antitoxin (DNA-binding transcriptional repressor) of toxin-antitoxin stability system